MTRSNLLVLVTSALLLGPAPCAAQLGTGAPPRDLAAALTPGARVRVTGTELNQQYVGIVAERRGDSITVWTEGFRGVDGKALQLSLSEPRLLEVSAGYELNGQSRMAAFMIAGGLLAGFETAALSSGEWAPFGWYVARMGAGALLFAMIAPRPAPRERWLPVTEAPKN